MYERKIENKYQPAFLYIVNAFVHISNRQEANTIIFFVKPDFILFEHAHSVPL